MREPDSDTSSFLGQASIDVHEGYISVSFHFLLLCSYLVACNSDSKVTMSIHPSPWIDPARPNADGMLITQQLLISMDEHEGSSLIYLYWILPEKSFGSSGDSILERFDSNASLPYQGKVPYQETKKS